MRINNFVFPYRNVPKDSRVIIYGMGDVGNNYIEQIEYTKYCSIIAVSDQNDSVNTRGYNYISPQDIPLADYDFVVIAIDSLMISASVYERFKELGIPMEKVTSGYHLKHEQQHDTNQDEQGCSDEGRLRVAVSFRGGLGDYVVLLAFVRKLIKIAPDIVLELYGIGSFLRAVFENENYVSKTYDDEDIQFRLDEIAARNDLLIQVVQFPQVLLCDKEKVKRLSPVLWSIIDQSVNDSRIEDLQTQPEYHLSIYHRAKLFHMNRYRFLGQGDIWNLNIEDSKLTVNEAFASEYKKLELPERYVTFNYGASKTGGDLQTKVWPKEYYDKLVGMLHASYPDIAIVQIGDSRAPLFEGIDKAVLNQDLRVVKHVLKNSILHIDGEGGLVHLATQLGTKCAVLFGPTPDWYYGYPQNINIVSTVCSDCCHVFKDWQSTCLLGDTEPRCMKSITPEMVMEKVNEYLEEQL